jgi:curved DNA-binding protein
MFPQPHKWLCGIAVLAEKSVTMNFVDYYQVLGISKTATADEIKAAYRKLARKYHPDLNPNDKEAKTKFQQLNEANEVLSDPENRRKYDQYGKDFKHVDENARAHQGNASAGGGPFTYSGNEEDFSDFFRSMFEGRGGRGQGGKFRGQDIAAELHLSLQQAYKPQQQILTVGGKQIRVTIPAGLENGQTLTLAGQGGAGVGGGPAGDLYITFAIADDAHFKRRGADLFATIDLDLYTAVLGGEVVIETLDGSVKLKVAPETQNDSKVKLKGKGFPVFKKEGEFGDLYVTYKVKLPTGLTDKQRELFNELAGREK